MHGIYIGASQWSSLDTRGSINLQEKAITITINLLFSISIHQFLCTKYSS